MWPFVDNVALALVILFSLNEQWKWFLLLLVVFLLLLLLLVVVGGGDIVFDVVFVVAVVRTLHYQHPLNGSPTSSIIQSMQT